MARPTHIVIDLSALRHNVGIAKTLAGDRKIMAAVKADAYGHGLLHCARALSSHVDGLAVATCEEGLQLREAGLDIPILALQGPFDTTDMALIRDRNLMPVLHCPEQLALLANATAKLESQIWLKVDTGMHRLGFSPADMETVIATVSPQAPAGMVLISHLAAGEDVQSALTETQIACWHALTSQISLETSLLNSSGTISGIAADSEWIRPGIMLYGAPPKAPGSSKTLRAVMGLYSAVMAVRNVAPGEQVGYGGTWTASVPSRIATIPVGYGDGYPRTARNGTPVRVGDTVCPLAGRVSMDMITVDVTHLDDCRVGMPVEVWGPNLAVNEVAVHAGTIGYELLTRLTGRIPRKIVDH